MVRSGGALVLLQDGLYYRARFAHRELLIPKSAITGLGLTNVFKNKSLPQNTVVISFKNEEGRPDRAVFRMPHPAQWMEAIKVNLLHES